MNGYSNSEIKIFLFQALESSDIKKLITNVGSGVGAAPAAGAAAPAPAAGKHFEDVHCFNFNIP